MTDTPTTEQSPGQIEDPGLSLAFRTKKEAVLQATITELTVADRLSRRAFKDIIRVPFRDDLGEFDVPLRMPTQVELDRILYLQQEIEKASQASDRAKSKQYEGELQGIMAELCQDPSMDVEFFRSGMFQVTDYGQLIKEILLEIGRRATDSRTFRKDKTGPGPV